MEMKYEFDEQLKKGSFGEKQLDAFFADEYTIRAATAIEQRKGIDRWFTHKQSGERYAIEYKTDEKAATTHNAFIETVSVDVDDKAGWAETSQADYIFYFIPPLELIYVLRPSKIKEQLERWKQKFKERTIPNKGYCTKGIIVPLAEVESIASDVIRVKEAPADNG